MRGATIYFNITPNEEWTGSIFPFSSLLERKHRTGSIFPFSSLLERKHINTMPTIMQPRNTTNNIFFPRTLPPS